MTTQVAVVNTPATSKINWAAALTLIASVLTIFGIDLTPETQLMILKAIGVGFPIVVGILRTWFTNKQPSVG